MYFSFKSVCGLYRFIFPLNVQQSANFLSFFSFLVSNASFDRRAVKSSFRKICAFRFWVMFLQCEPGAIHVFLNSFSSKSDDDWSTAGTLSPKRWLLSWSCSDSGGVTPILSLITAITMASMSINAKRYCRT